MNERYGWANEGAMTSEEFHKTVRVSLRLRLTGCWTGLVLLIDWRTLGPAEYFSLRDDDSFWKILANRGTMKLGAAFDFKVSRICQQENSG